jgi:tRNA G18 (ribose-2'-O)-methylase SpoU
MRMMEAIGGGSKVHLISFLTTPELADTVIVPAMKKNNGTPTTATTTATSSSFPMIYTADKAVLDIIRGQKLNVGDAILAMIQFPMVSPLDELMARPPILILENVRNAENVGSILRTSFCLGIRSVIASTTTWSAVKDSRAARCSMGTMYFQRYFLAAVASSGNKKDHQDDINALVTTIHTLRDRGIRVYGIEIGDDAQPIAPHGRDRNWAAVMGNEDVGLSRNVATACDHVMYIPQAHGDSLNVGHAAAIAMFELGRQSPKLEHDSLATCI